MKFTISQSENSGEFWFRIVATNGNVLASSQQYSDKRSAISAIESIQQNAAEAAIVDET
ncbi:MAG: YegP family protein [Actinomycetota bacterium]